jgi:serine/threonine protein kinase
MPPPRLSDYRLGEVLGVGTVGTIYAAIDPETQQRVAIKRLHPSVSQDDMIRARFRREIMILERLDHPNIVRCFGGGEEPGQGTLKGQLFYVMELVNGGTIKELLATSGRFNWPVVVEIGRQLCSALQFAHNHGVVHRDLKPSNLFITRDGQIKLGDFGIARDLHDADITSSGMTVGTHAYMAPEQIRGESSISGKADLYSLGCCLFEMLVGHTPFVGENYQQLYDQHLKAEPPRANDMLAEPCPTPLDDALHELLSKDPNDRPFNARKVQATMLQLSDRQIGTDPDSENESTEDVVTHGRKILQAQIQKQRQMTVAPEVSWTRLLAILAAIVVLLVVYAVVRS